jgi:hypothetical protein
MGRGRLAMMSHAHLGFEPEWQEAFTPTDFKTILNLVERPIEHAEGCADLSWRAGSA